MNQYFTAHSIHLEEQVDIDGKQYLKQTLSQKNYRQNGKHAKIVSIGQDDILYIRQLNSNNGIFNNMSNEQQQQNSVLNQERVNLPVNQKNTNGCSFQCIALHPNGNDIILASQKKIFKVNIFNLKNGSSNQEENQSSEGVMKLIYETLGKIRSIQISKTGKYLTAATQQQKCIVINLFKERNMKCRPGHRGSIISATFSEDQRYIMSIGQDRMMLVYELFSNQFDKQPLEVFRFTISRGIQQYQWSGDFHPNSKIICCPGFKEVQMFQLVTTSNVQPSKKSKQEQRQKIQKWIQGYTENQKKTAFPHDSTISLTKFINESLLITSTQQPSNFFIWGFYKQEKLIHVQGFHFTKICCIAGFEKIFAVDNSDVDKNGGKVFQFNKNLPKVDHLLQLQQNEQKNTNNIMDIQTIQKQDQIRFDNLLNSIQNKQKQNDEQQDQDDQQQDYNQRSHKSKADKIVTNYPQPAISTGTVTNYFGGSMFLLTNLYGNIIKKKDLDQNQTIIEVQLTPKSFQAQHKNHQYSEYSSGSQKIQKKILFKNRDIFYFAMNAIGIVYANYSQFGFWGKQYKQWQKQWVDIAGVAIGNSWLAIINQQQIMILDFMGNQIRTIAFDRIFVAIDGFQNLLAIVYHDTVPMFGNQSLSMQIITVDSFKQSKNQRYHVPIKPLSILKWFGFSQEGMILSQDSLGGLRAFNLSSKIWSNVQVTQLPYNRRVWIVGMINYQLKYWKTTQTQPQPTVSPRLNQKINTLFLGSSENQLQNQDLSNLLWQRFCLDHEKQRNKLWGKFRIIRSDDHPCYQLSKSILTQLQNQQANLQLDRKFIKFIRGIIQENSQKALYLAKNNIRSIEVGREIIQIFDQFKLRSSAIQLQKYYDEAQQELDYQNIQVFKLEALKKQIEKLIKPKSEDPMKRRGNNGNYVSMSWTQSQQSSSQGNSLANSRVSQQSVQNNVPKINNQKITSIQKQKSQLQNPFLKKKTTSEDAQHRRKQIQSQLIKNDDKDKTLLPKRGRVIHS